MLTAPEKRRAMTGGGIALAGIALFAGAATWALLQTGLGGEDRPLFDPYLWNILRFTVLQALLSAGLSVLGAIPFARALARQPRFPGRIWLVRLLALPLGLPVITGALGLLEVWGRNGWMNSLLKGLGMEAPISIYGLTGILLAHVFFNFPLCVRLTLSSLERLPGEYWRLASNLGMGPWHVFRHVEWPEIRRQVPGMAGLVLMLATTSFTLVLLLGGGPAATTLEVAVYQALRFDFDPPRAVSLALVQILLTGLLMLALSRLARPASEGSTLEIRPDRPDGALWSARAMDALVLIAGTLFLALPFMAILIGGLKADLIRLMTEPVFLRALLTSLAIGMPAGMIAVLLVSSIVHARLAIQDMHHPPPVLEKLGLAAPGAASLILLFPPTVLGTGWFLILGPTRAETAAPVLVIIINALMAFPFVLRILDPAITTHRQRTGRLAASLGLEGFNRIRRVDWPALRRPYVMALSFGTALSLGDLGAVALFSSDRLMTLPWLLYSRMGSYRTDDAGGLALLLAVLCLLLTLGGTPTENRTSRHAE